MYAKLQDSIYFSAPDNSTLFVNLFESSTVAWGDVTLTQASVFPVGTNHTTTLTVTTKSAAQSWTLALRVPFWATGANVVSVNGEAAAPASKLVPSE